MDFSNVLPRWGTREHKQLGLLLVTLLVVAVLMLIPDLAFAAGGKAAGFDGTAVPDAGVGKNLDTSFRAWWKFLAKPGFWIAMIWLAVCVLAFSSRGWQLPFVLGAIFLFGEMVVNGFQKLMG